MMADMKEVIEKEKDTFSKRFKSRVYIYIYIYIYRSAGRGFKYPTQAMRLKSEYKRIKCIFLMV